MANCLVVANYVSGNVLSFPIREDGGLKPFHQVLQHAGSGPNKERQEQAHAHMVFPYKEKQMLVVDLGIDRVKAYEFIDAKNTWKPIHGGDIQIPDGAGPRHMQMDQNGKYAYVLSELYGEVIVFKEHAGKFELVQQVSFVPKNFTGDFGGGAIRIHPNGKYLYTSCRGADVITVFRVSDVEGTLDFIDIYPSEGKTPRDFNITPSGNWLIIANQDSDELAVFKLDQQYGTLSKHSSFSTGTPVNICWR